jgi:glutathione S-transferase
VNPVGRIPVLTRPDGPALIDSRVICRYLDDRAGGRLYPAAALWDVLTLESLADGMTDSAVSMRYELAMRPAGQQSPEWIAAQWGKIAHGLDALGDRWSSHLAGPFNAGQIAVACLLGYLDFRHADRGWRQGRVGLADWFSTVSERPSLADTVPV